MKYNLEIDTAKYIKDNFKLSNEGVLIRTKTNEICTGWFDKSSGYWKVKVKGKSMLFHRLIFYLYNGYLPNIVDHIDRDINNNHYSNLRDAEYRGNNTVNSEPRSDNTSGYKGVTWHKSSGKWMSSVFFKGKRYHLGLYTDKIEAAKSYDMKVKELFGDFAKLNLGENKIGD